MIRADDLQLDEEPLAAPTADAARTLAGLTVHEMERRLIFETLRAHQQQPHATRRGLLGISVRTLRNKLAEYRTCGTMQASLS